MSESNPEPEPELTSNAEEAGQSGVAACEEDRLRESAGAVS